MFADLHLHTSFSDGTYTPEELVERAGQLRLAAVALTDHDTDEAFERFLKKNRPAWVPKFKISALDAIGLIHQAGGLAVMAHPGLNRTDGIIPNLVSAGLDGLECFHTKHAVATSNRYVRLAQE